MNSINNAPKSAVSTFFKIGDKITKGDPKRKADFDYYLLWVMFLSFLSIFISQIFTGIKFIGINKIWLAVKSFAWGLVMLAIVWFQYSALKQTWQNRNRIKNLPIVKNLMKDSKPLEEDSLEQIMEEFKDESI